MTITIKTENLRGEIAPLHHRYKGQTSAQPAYVELDEDGTVRADYNPEIGGGISFSVFHRRDLRWGVANAIRGDALADYLESAEARALLERIHAGHGVEWDGNNNVGKLDADAQEAEAEFEAALQALGEVEDNMGAVWSVDEWTQYQPFDEIWEAGQSLAQAVAAMESAADAERVELDGDIERYLLDRAERANERGECYRPEVLAALHADGRHPVDEEGDEWVSIAHSLGRKDGTAAAQEQNPTAEQVEAWFAPGNVLPDEGLINALETAKLAVALGLTVAQVEERGEAWTAAIADYNRGYKEGAIEAIS